MLNLTEKLREKVAQVDGDVCTMCEWTPDEHVTGNLTTFLLDGGSGQLYRKYCNMKQPLTLNDLRVKIPGNAGSTTKPL